MRMLVGGLLMMSLSAYAGGMLLIPVQLLKIENTGRAIFLQNALIETGLQNDQMVKYSDFRSIVVGGDEVGSKYDGGYFIFEAHLQSSDGRNYKCHQFLSVGNFNPNLTRPIDCELL